MLTLALGALRISGNDWVVWMWVWFELSVLNTHYTHVVCKYTMEFPTLQSVRGGLYESITHNPCSRQSDTFINTNTRET